MIVVGQNKAFAIALEITSEKYLKIQAVKAVDNFIENEKGQKSKRMFDYQIIYKTKDDELLLATYESFTRAQEVLCDMVDKLSKNIACYWLEYDYEDLGDKLWI